MTNGQIHIGSMSHETAIGILKLMLEAMETYDSISPTPERVNAVKMGIEALEQESNCSEIPTGSTTKDYLGVDCISRRAVIEEMEKRHAKGDYITKGFISSLPSVTPQLSSGLEKNSKKLEKDFGESDCISRSDVLKLMQDNWHTHNGDWAMQESMDDIRALPAVTPQEPRKGHWMGDSYGYICSNCEHSLNDLAQSMDYISFSKPKYCPNCGAKMIELQESEDKEQTDDKDNN